jgi:hypothetical protein
MAICMVFGWMNVDKAKRFYLLANNAAWFVGLDAMLGDVALIGKPTEAPSRTDW